MAEENELKQNTLKVRLKHAYKSKDEWETEANSQLILLEGEFGIESGTNKIKMGNGTTQWKDLPYLTFDALPLEGGMLRGKVTFGDELYYIDTDGTIQFKTIKTLAEGGFEGNWNGNAIPVSKGGTGLTTFPANQILVGKGEQGITYLANATEGQILFAQGTNKLPAYQNYFGTTFYNGTSSTYYIADGSGNGYYNALSIGSDRNTEQQSYKFKVSGPSLFDGKIYFADTSNTSTAGDTPVGIYGSVGTNNGWRIVGLGDSNAGSLEIATCDDGTEPIYVRQYSDGGGSAGFATIARTLTLLDGSGHTHIPGNLVLNSDVFFQNSATTQMPVLKFLKTNDTSNLGVVLSGSGATFVGAGESAAAMGTEKGGDIEDLFLTADRDIYFCTFNEAATVNAKENYGIKMDKTGNFYPLRVRNTTKVTQDLGLSSNHWSNSYIDKMFVGQVEEASKEGLFQNEQSQRIVINPSTNKAVSWLISAYENVSKAEDGTLRVLPKDEFLKFGSIKHTKDEFAAILSMSGHLKVKTLEVENLTSTSTWDTGFIWLSGTAITGQTRSSNTAWTIKLGGNNSAHIGNYFQITNKNNEQAFAVFSDTKYVQVTTHLKVGSYTYPKKADGTTDDVKYVLATKNFISESWVRTDGNTGWYSEKWAGGWYMIDGTFIRNYNDKQLLIGRNTKSSTALMSGQFIVTSVASGTSTTDLQTTGGDNVAIELWRGANASWQIANESGTFYIRNNYTSSKQTTYSQTSMIMDYNTGAMAVNYLAIAKTGLARDTGYRLYVNGTSYLNGNTSVNGNLDLTASHGIIFTATAGGTTTSTPTGLTYGRLQGYGTFAINADTDGSKTEYLILTSGRGMSSSTSDGLTVGYDHVGIFGYSTSYTFYVNGTSYIEGDLTIPNNHAYYGILGSNSSTAANNVGGLTWFNLAGTAGCAANVNDTPTNGWWYILRNRHTNQSNNYYTDIAIPFNDNSIYYKRVAGNTGSETLPNSRWVKVLDDVNYASILDSRYINASGDTMTGHLNATAGLTWTHAYWNPGGNVYCQPTGNNQEWSFDVGSASYTGSYFHVWSARNGASMLRCFSDNNSVDIPSGIFTVSGGNAYFTKTIVCSSQIGDYGEGIRLNCNDGQWATITMGSTGNTGTRTNCWSIHRKSDNNFCISRNSADGANGLVMTTTGMGLGTTAPGYRLDISGNMRATGRIYADEWIQFRNCTGLYSPVNGAHFYPNDTTTYGQWKILGSKGGYSGIQFGDTKTYMTVMDSSEHKGLYQEDQGRWLFYYQRSTGNVGIRTSSVAGYNFNVEGTSYFKGDVLIKNSSGDNYGGKLNFGDGDFVHLYEITDDNLEIKAFTTWVTGKLSIGNGAGYTTTPTYKLYVDGNGLLAAEFVGQVKIASAYRNGTGLDLLVGDDCYIGDCNVANSIGLRGASDSSNAGIYFGYDDGYGWGTSQPHLIHDQGWGTYNSTYKYSTLRTNARIHFDNAPGYCWIGGGGVDGYSRGNYNNLVIASWYGITFFDTCTGHADITMNVRNGYAYATSWQSVSDRRAKDDLGEISEKEAFTLLTELKPSLFTFKRDNHNLRKINVGFYAQDLRDILIKHNIGNRDFLSVTLNQNSLLTNEQLEDLGIYANEEDVQYSLDYSKMTPILWKGWQIHEDKISILEKKIEMLEEEIKELKGDKKIC